MQKNLQFTIFKNSNESCTKLMQVMHYLNNTATACRIGDDKTIHGNSMFIHQMELVFPAFKSKQYTLNRA